MSHKRFLFNDISLSDIDMRLLYLFLHDRGSVRHYLIRNTLYPPYKNPRLPFPGYAGKLHALLRQLKIAHAYLVKEILELESNLPKPFLWSRLLFGIDRKYGRTDKPETIGAKHIYDHSRQPVRIEGFEIHDGGAISLSYAFDFSPFYNKTPLPLGHMDFDSSKINIGPIIEASEYYNECMVDFSNEEYTIMLANLVFSPDEFAMHYIGIYRDMYINSRKIIVI